MELRKTLNGVEHGLLNTLINQVSKKSRFKNMEPKQKSDAEAKILRDSKIERVRYINYANQDNGCLVKDYYVAAGEPIYLFKFLHDHIYDVPLGLIEEVNDPTRKVPQREGLIGKDNVPLNSDGPAKRVHHFIKEF